MVTLIVVKNPFTPQDGREIKEIKAEGTVKDLIDKYKRENTVIRATINGEIVEDKTVLKDGDFVVIYPMIQGGGGFLGTLLGVALSVVSFGVGGIVASGIWGMAGITAATGWAMVGGYLAAATIMYLGSSLVGRFMGRQNKGSFENNATYGWGDIVTMEGQNNPIALTYGKVKSGGQTIGRYINTIPSHSKKADKEVLNWLVSCGEGELELSDIRINDNPIKYYGDITVETRSGTNTQEIISNFNDTYFTKQLGYELEGGDTNNVDIKHDAIYLLQLSDGTTRRVPKEKADTLLGKYGSSKKGLGGVMYMLGGLINIATWGFARFQKVNEVKREFNIPENVKVVSASEVDYTDKELNELSGVWRHDTAQGNATEGLIVRISLPNGLYYSNDKGGLDNASVHVIAQYKRTSDDKWALLADAVITENRTGAIKREYRVDNLVPDEYEVRVKCLSRSHEPTNNRASVRCYWDGLTSIVYDDFSYPCTSLIGIKALATSQLSGNPTLTFMKERKSVYVYDTDLNKYVLKNANNPAWACYDMIHQARRLKNINTNEYEIEVRGAKKELIRYNDFKRWAKFCDDKDLKVNIEINRLGELLEVINKDIACVGRGMVVQFGTKFGCIFAHKQQAVQMFNMGNIIENTFSEEFLPKNDRANCVEVTFTNKDKEYERDVVTIYGDTYDTDDYEKTAQMTFDGITDYKQAYREGKYQLECNKRQLRTISFSASIDSIACTVGDVVLVSHDVPRWSYSGRIQDVDLENGIITLPIELESKDDNYLLQYRTVDDYICKENCKILTAGTKKTTVYIENLSNKKYLPQVDDIFNLGIENKGAKPFVIQSINRTQEFIRTITAIEYSEALFDENYSIPEIQYSTDTTKPTNITDLVTNMYQFTDESNSDKAKIYASWTQAENGGTYTVLISEDKGENWQVAVSNISRNNVELEVEPYKEYKIKVLTSKGMRQSSGVISGIIKDEPPKAPVEFKLKQSDTNNSKITFTWNKNDEPDMLGYQLTINDKDVIFVKDNTYDYTVPKSGEYVFKLNAIDKAKNKSDSVTINKFIKLEPQDVTGLVIEQDKSSRTLIKLSWDTPKEKGIDHYIVKVGDTWENGKLISDYVKDTFIEFNIKDEYEHTYFVKAVGGNEFESINAVNVKKAFKLKPHKVNAIQAYQDKEDKAMLRIQWQAIEDTDILGYQVKIGDTWDSGEPLPFTRELYTSYTLKENGIYHIMIKAINRANFESDLTDITLNADITPKDVEGFIIYKDGDALEIYWDEVNEKDVTSYELREGYSWDLGAVIASGITTTNYHYPISNERVYKFFIKAKNKNGSYSKKASMQSIKVTDLLPKNIVLTINELALANGNKNKTEIGKSRYNFATFGGRFSDYPTTKFNDNGGLRALKIADEALPTIKKWLNKEISISDDERIFTYETQVIDIEQLITCTISAEFNTTAVQRGGKCDLYISTSQYNNNDWTSWEIFKPIQRTFQYAKLKVVFGIDESTKINNLPEVIKFDVIIDVPDTDIAKSVMVAKGGEWVDYNHKFFTIPTVVPSAVGEFIHAELISKDKEKCFIKVKDRKNNDVGGKVDIRIKGY